MTVKHSQTNTTCPFSEHKVLINYHSYRAKESMSTSDTDALSSSPICTTIELTFVVATWWLRIWRRTYLVQTKRREHNRHMYFGAPPCRLSIWRFSALGREDLKLQSLQTRFSNWPRYLSGRRWGCSRWRWLIRPASRVNWHPQPSQVRSDLRSCTCRLWITSVIALPSTLSHWSQRCSMAPRWTVETWSFICVSSWNTREQYSHTNDFSAWSTQHTHYITMEANKNTSKYNEKFISMLAITLQRHQCRDWRLHSQASQSICVQIQNRYKYKQELDSLQQTIDLCASIRKLVHLELLWPWALTFWQQNLINSLCLQNKLKFPQTARKKYSGG